MRARDNQRSKVYKAERLHTEFEKHRIEDIKEVKKFVYKTLALKSVSKYWTPKPKIKDGRGCRRATGSARALTFPKWSRTKMVILHELAHAVTPSHYAWHGKEFCANFYYLVKVAMGKDSAHELAMKYNECNVDFTTSRLFSYNGYFDYIK